jgi:hypothetical protein
MVYRALADLVLVLHLLFILFVALGALAVVRYRWMAWAHFPMVVWAALIEFAGWHCPLTPLENWLRRRGGEAGYASGFIEHYLLPIIYPGSLTREIQIALGALVVIVNGLLYAYCVLAWRRHAHAKRRDLR